ncbi:TlpA disulfide reductase family protein [Sagittula salina]|uniref:TlpA family protein disulfide reductase n=1 Tax=Sagittula salina TaxID=2820268 RepID=A0A940MQ97_9RHOB|nr:TlpA disulfide reductase family protein [Sagittula salina]MBP0482791.1 TlpA family protein disulfide reductase [Sagittula salina]
MQYFDEFGHRHDLNDIVGDLIVVNVWATWCVPCVTELPSLGKLRSAVAQDGIEVFALSVDRGGVPKTRHFFEQHGRPDLNYGFDPRGVFLDQLGNAVLPTTLVLQRDGQVLAVSERALDWSAPEVVAWLRRLKTPES